MKRFLREVTLPYVIYLMFFLGVGLLSGSVVHFPQAPLRYFLIGTSGAVVFTVGAVLTETVIHHRSLAKAEALRFVLCTLTLSIGIGMISGAIQHFTDIPQYASALIPIGFVLSLVSYMLKEKIPFSRKNSGLLAVKIAAIGLPLWLVLHTTAMQMPTSGHSHGGGGSSSGHEQSGHAAHHPAQIQAQTPGGAGVAAPNPVRSSSSPAKAAASSSTAQVMLAAPANLVVNRPALLKLQVKDQTGRAIEAFDTVQEKRMHLIVVSNDLQSFQHLHPTYRAGGDFAVEAQFPQPGGYALFADYRPTGQAEQVAVSALSLPGAAPVASNVDLTRSQTVGDVTVQLEAPALKAGEAATLSFNLSHDGMPLRDLQPYLGEKGHLVIVRQTAPLTKADYIHAHAQRDAPNNTGAGQVSFEAQFPQPGAYKLWGQFNHAGEIVVADFWVEVT